LSPGGLVDIEHAGGESVATDRHLARHCIGDQREPSGARRGCQQHVGAGEVGIHRTAAIALAAVMTRGAAVVRPGDDRQSRWNAGDVVLVGGVLDEQLPAAWRRWRQEVTVWMVVEALV